MISVLTDVFVFRASLTTVECFCFGIFIFDIGDASCMAPRMQYCWTALCFTMSRVRHPFALCLFS